MKKLLSTLLVACTLATSALAQGTGQLPAGGIWGNPTASKAPATATTVFGTLNQIAGCTTQNNIIVRGASLWACQATGSGVVTFLGTPSSANLAAALTDKTGTGVAVFNISPTFTTPVLGNASGGTLSLSGALTYGGVTLSNSVTGTGSMVLATSPTIAGPTITGSLTATGLVTYTALASAAIASTSEYYTGTSSKLVQAGVIYPSEVTITYGGTTTIDFDTLINGAVTLTGNITTLTLTNVKAGKAGQIRFIQSGAGSFTWPAGGNTIFKYAGGVLPALTTGSTTAVDVLTYSCSSATFCTAALLKDVRNP